MRRGDIVVYTGKDWNKWQELYLVVSNTEYMNIFGEISETIVVPGEHEYSIVSLYSKGEDEEWKDYYALFCLEAADWKNQAMRDINVAEEFIKELGQ
jgi:hypothetical protein